MSYISGTDVSCGIKQFAGINDYNNPALAVFDMARETQYHAQWFGAIIFSTTENYMIGHRMRQFIQNDLKLGHIQTVGPFRNPNTGNQITLFIWEVQHKDLLLWYNATTEAECANYKYKPMLTLAIQHVPFLVKHYNIIRNKLSTWFKSTQPTAAAVCMKSQD